MSCADSRFCCWSPSARVAIAPIRHMLLRGAGRLLVASDEIEPADLLAMDVESRESGLLAVADLYRTHIGRSVGLLTPTSNAIDDELERPRRRRAGPHRRDTRSTRDSEKRDGPYSGGRGVEQRRASRRSWNGRARIRATR